MREEPGRQLVKNIHSAPMRTIPEIIRIALPVYYFLTMIYLVFFARRRRRITTHDVNFVPFENILKNTGEMSSGALYHFYSNLIGNIVLFMPFPFILILFFRINRSSSILFSGLVLSITIEILQYIFKAGVSDIDDIILNTLGTFAGLVLYKLLVKLGML